MRSVMLPVVIDIQDLWFSFNGGPVLKEVQLQIRSRDFVALIGPNGGGKTTLLKLMLGLLEPDRGTVRILDRPPQEITHRVGYMPQEIHINKHFPISVDDVVLTGRLRPRKSWFRYTREDKEAAERALSQVGMLEHRHRRMSELSGGQCQRAYIARALVCDPDILFLDEPTASVDQKGETEIYELLNRLNETVTIIVVSHDLMVLSSYVKSVACVNQRVFYHGAAEITEEMLEQAYHCPVELVTHGRLPHRVLRRHDH